MYFIYFVVLMRGCDRKNGKPENAKKIAAAAVEGVRKRGRPCKRWRGELEKD